MLCIGGRVTPAMELWLFKSAAFKLIYRICSFYICIIFVLRHRDPPECRIYLLPVSSSHFRQESSKGNGKEATQIKFGCPRQTFLTIVLFIHEENFRFRNDSKCRIFVGVGCFSERRTKMGLLLSRAVIFNIIFKILSNSFESHIQSRIPMILFNTQFTPFSIQLASTTFRCVVAMI